VQDLSPVEFLRPFGPTHVSAPDVGPLPDFQLWSGAYPVTRDGHHVARLTIQCGSAMRPLPPAQGPGIQMNLTFKAPSPDPSEDQVIRLLNMGRSAIVRTFTELTTEGAHKHWGRFQ
jgi:hypothetical protein